MTKEDFLKRLSEDFTVEDLAHLARVASESLMLFESLYRPEYSFRLRGQDIAGKLERIARDFDTSDKESK